MPAFKTLATNMYCLINVRNVESGIPPPAKCHQGKMIPF